MSKNISSERWQRLLEDVEAGKAQSTWTVEELEATCLRHWIESGGDRSDFDFSGFLEKLEPVASMLHAEMVCREGQTAWKSAVLVKVIQWVIKTTPTRSWPGIVRRVLFRCPDCGKQEQVEEKMDVFCPECGCRMNYADES